MGEVRTLARGDVFGVSAPKLCANALLAGARSAIGSASAPGRRHHSQLPKARPLIEGPLPCQRGSEPTSHGAAQTRLALDRELRREPESGDASHAKITQLQPAPM